MELIDQLMRLEEDFYSGRLKDSPEKLSALLADSFKLISVSGKSVERSKFLTSLSNDENIELVAEEMHCQFVSETSALVTYKLAKRNKDTADIRYSLHSSVWKLDGQKWQIVFHQETKTGEETKAPETVRKQLIDFGYNL